MVFLSRNTATTGERECFWTFERDRRAALPGRAGSPLPAKAADGAHGVTRATKKQLDLDDSGQYSN
jgi:hypothetical protein